MAKKLPFYKIRRVKTLKGYEGETIYSQRIFNIFKMRFERN